MIRVGTTSRVRLTAALCAALVLAAAGIEAQVPVAPPEARTLLLKMATAVGAAQRLRVSVHASYDSTQDSGQKIEWNEIRTLTLQRPDRLRMEAEKSNGARSLVVFDGKQINAYDEAGRVYAQTPQPGGVDETLVHLVRDLGIRLPLAVFFVSRLATELDQRVRSVAYVEKTGILGGPAHHLVGRTDSVNFQVWIADAEQALPQRIVLTYPGAPGQPQFRAQFSAWNLAPEPADALFTFTAPADARRIPFAAALASAAAAKKGPKP